MKFFSNKPTQAEGGCPRPDLKKFDNEDEFNIPQKDKSNRTQPNSTPVASIARSKSGGYSVSARKAAAQPGVKDVARLVFNSNDWLFTQATAVASVPTEEDGFTIKPSANELVNENGNAFTHKMMKKMYPTFIGAHNYIDHIQEPNESRGVIIDVTPRKVPLEGSESGEYAIYIDVLIATSKKRDPEWAHMIEDKEVVFLSMGAESSALQCSKCGHLSFEEGQDCEHMEFDLGYHYFDKDGNRRRVAALVTDHENDDGESFAYFVELSYLSVDPAFPGAVQGYVLDIPKDTNVEVTVPRSALEREAFQVHKETIGGIQ